MQEGRESWKKEIPGLPGSLTIQETVINGFFPMTMGTSISRDITPRAEGVES